MATHRFHIGDVLTITTGRMLSPRGIVGLRGTMAFLTGQGGPDDTMITDTGCAKLKPLCTAELVSQFPWLGKVDPSGIDEQSVNAWMSDMIAKHGEHLEVQQITAGA